MPAPAARSKTPLVLKRKAWSDVGDLHVERLFAAVIDDRRGIVIAAREETYARG
jgi:hypothetical protein